MQDFKKYYELNLKQTKKDIKESVSPDQLIIHCIKNIEELQKVSNAMVKRLREWYALYLPEFSNSVSDHEKFVELIIKNDRTQLLSELKLKESDSMGKNLEENDLKPIISLAKECNNIYKEKKSLEDYLDKLMDELMPNTKSIAGTTISAKLLEHAGSLKRLSELPSTTVQLFGAEKALFRHLHSNAKCPKYGLLHEHPLIPKTKRKDHGKAARALADKISIAAKVDYFKGEFVGDKLKAQIEKKFGKW